MSNMDVIDDYGVVSEPATLTLQRLLPGPIDRVWAYLTDSDLRRKWLASGDMQPEKGSSFSLTWRNDELTDPPGRKPDGFGTEHHMESRITGFDPPHRLSFTWYESGEITIELKPVGEKVLLTLTHTGLGERRMRLMVSAGWHMHLDLLSDRLSERKSDPFWDRWSSLKDEYDRRLPL